MNNTALFSIIGILMLAIVGIGGYAVLPQKAAQEPQDQTSGVGATQISGQPNSPQTSVSNTQRGDDDDENDDEDDDGTRSSRTPTQTTSTQASPTTPAPAAQPTSGGITMAEVKKHNSAASCYTAVSGNVYDVTSWINQHPGGSQAIISLCGTDGTAAFTQQHGGQRKPETELASFKIGVLAK